MIYQQNSSFKVFPLKAEWQVDEVIRWQYVTDKTLFEKMLLEQLNIEATASEEVTLPAITYYEVSLTLEQQDRFDKVKDIKSITLDQIKEFVLYGLKLDNDEYKIMLMQADNAQIVYDLMMKDVKIESLELKNLSLENNQADLLYQLMIGGVI